MDTLPIDYLTHLHYIDLLNLCQTNKKLNSIYNNNMLRDILAFRTDVIFPKSINITKILKKLDNTLLDTIRTYYPTFPVWINKELFYIEHRKTMYCYIIEVLAPQIINILYDSDLLYSYEYDGVDIQHIHYAFISKYVDVSGLYISDSTIKISDKLVYYIIYGIKHTKDIKDDILPIIKNLLFIR
jgi:hypothetical protein